MKKDSSISVGSTITVDGREVSYDFSGFLSMDKTEAYEMASELVKWYVNDTTDGIMRSRMVKYILIKDDEVSLFVNPMSSIGGKDDVVRLSRTVKGEPTFSVYRWNGIRHKYVKETRYVA